MKINELVVESQTQLDELSLGGVAKGIGSAIGKTANAVGGVAGGVKGTWDAAKAGYNSGKAFVGGSRVAGTGGTPPAGQQPQGQAIQASPQATNIQNQIDQHQTAIDNLTRQMNAAPTTTGTQPGASAQPAQSSTTPTQPGASTQPNATAPITSAPQDQEDTDWEAAFNSDPAKAAADKRAAAQATAGANAQANMAQNAQRSAQPAPKPAGTAMPTKPFATPGAVTPNLQGKLPNGKPAPAASAAQTAPKPTGTAMPLKPFSVSQATAPKSAAPKPQTYGSRGIPGMGEGVVFSSKFLGKDI